MSGRRRAVGPSVVALSLLTLSGCATLPGVASLCRPAASTSIVLAADADELSGTTRCAAGVTASTVAPVGSVQQRGTQTRTVGVPRGFLIAMIALIVLVSLA